ncbi:MULTISPECIES: helix-turn-helix domain-containing protein [unclassified Brevibacterium]|uniref:helix-turn-helix domain-containing protein n=1 Tax=unclassified Brevibacterium TaxID=2614124 RepID=UPI001F2234C9|nr:MULTISPECIES: helix-turn-helix domain-containing protein [unclassified Brevibacterium]MCF2571654.1 helix-turn-helix domain-containing protein [Brevibacterium sp. UCMA 11754]MCF2589106.1 helix-turn-helix domain-containing protein [Brevibacterium sp. UCMA 11752]
MVEEFESLHVVCHLDSVLTQRGLSLTELSRLVDVSLANLSVLKNNRAKAIRYSTLIALCQVLDCQPGDLFTVNVRPD